MPQVHTTFQGVCQNSFKETNFQTLSFHALFPKTQYMPEIQGTKQRDNSKYCVGVQKVNDLNDRIQILLKVRWISNSLISKKERGPY